MLTASGKENLTRIRDNQRRSRARRKLYLQELEARLRQYELQGIEASAEIRIAAERVADENKKLRALLALLKIRDNNIVASLHSSPSDDTLTPGYFGDSNSTIQVLEQLFKTREACFSDGNAGALTNSGMRAAGCRDTSTSQGAVQSLLDPIHPHGRRRSGLQSMGKAVSLAHQFITPSGSESRASNASLGEPSSPGVEHSQMLPPGLLPGNPSPASYHPRHGPQMFDFNPQLLPSNLCNNHLPTAQQHLQPYDQRSSTCVLTTTDSSNINSCVIATDIGSIISRVDLS